MHKLWACGGNLSLPLPVVQPAEGSVAASWDDLAVKIFTTLLSSRYGNVIESAMIGLNAFISWRPQNLSSIFEAIGDDEWRLRWLLTLAEAWAIANPDAVSLVVEKLDQIGTSMPLDIRLQAWIIRLILSRQNEAVLPHFPFLESETAPFEISANHIPGILETTPEMRGSFRLVDHHEVAASILRKVKTASGIECADLECSIGARMLCLSEKRDHEYSWPEAIRNDSDWLCKGEEGHRVINEELDRVLSKQIASPLQLLRFAQGFLGSEDGWILRHSPMPHPVIENWPSSSLLGGDYNNPPPASEVRKWLRQTAMLDGIKSDERVLAACLKTYSWREDFIYECWFQERPGSSSLAERIPTTMNGRSFVWMLTPNWWEPALPLGKRSIGFRTGGYQQLLHCFAEIIPSRIWFTQCGWTPSRENPYAWNKEGVPAARFEVLHGPLDSLTAYAGRTPILHRWIVNSEAFNDLMESIPSMSFSEDMQRVPFKDE
jgi:hypothetical protein